MAGALRKTKVKVINFASYLYAIICFIKWKSKSPLLGLEALVEAENGGSGKHLIR